MSYLQEWHMLGHNFFLGPHPLGPWGGSKILFSGHGYVAYQIKGGYSSRPEYTEKILIYD